MRVASSENVGLELPRIGPRWVARHSVPTSVIRGISLLPAPLTLAALQLWALLQLPPFWRLLADPIYQYLLNGVAIISGVMPGHTDHPGTTTQWINGFVQLLYFNVAGSNDSFVADVVSRPEIYLRVDTLLVILVQFVAFCFASWQVAKHLGLFAAFVFQAITLPSSSIFLFTLFPIPESTVWICTMFMVGLLVPLARQPRRALPIWTVLTIGFVIALGSGAKIIFIPVALLAVVWLRWKDALVALTTAFVGGVLVLWPVRNQFERMWHWFSSTASTSARYPEEAQSRSGITSLMTSPEKIVVTFPFTLLALILTAIVIYSLIFQQANRSAICWRLLGPLTVILGLWSFTYKAWRPNDLMSLPAIAGLLSATAVFSLIHVINKSDGPLRRRGISILVIGSLIASLGLLVSAANSTVNAASKRTDYDDQIAFLEERWRSGAAIATGYGTFNMISALNFANGSSNKVATAEIVDQYPGWIDFSIWNSMFYIPTRDGIVLDSCQAIQSLAQAPQGLLLAPGRDIDVSTATLQYESVLLAKEANFGQFDVYRVLDVRCR